MAERGKKQAQMGIILVLNKNLCKSRACRKLVTVFVQGAHGNPVNAWGGGVFGARKPRDLCVKKVN
jgi:hypothetical protein